MYDERGCRLEGWIEFPACEYFYNSSDTAGAVGFGSTEEAMAGLKTKQLPAIAVGEW
jgi:hypothetical protein